MNSKLAICFFGITRSLSHTIESIEVNILGAAQRIREPVVLSHFFDQKWINNPRSGEKGAVCEEEHALLDNDWLCLEEPDSCLQMWDYKELQQFGDAWGDDFQSLRNLVHQLHSLNAVCEEALERGVEVCIFCRPDLRYHDSLLRPLKRAIRRGGNVVYLPGWQAWEGGLNDRFAICVGRNAIAAYGKRIQDAHAFCKEGNTPLHSERLLEYALSCRGIQIIKIKTRASRVRIDGTLPAVDIFRSPLWKISAKAAQTLGVKPMVHMIIGRFLR